MSRRLLILLWILLLIVPVTGCQQEQAPPSGLPPVAEPSLFEGEGLSFLYPSNWQMMTEKDIDELWKTELRGQLSGFSRQGAIWEGGVLWGHIDPSNHPNSANIFTLIGKISDIPGPMSEAEFDNAFNDVKASFEAGLGNRLYSIQKQMIGDFQAIEIEGLGKSRNQILRSIFIFAKADHIYYLGCGVSKDSQDFFKPVFDEAIASLKVSLKE